MPTKKHCWRKTLNSISTSANSIFLDRLIISKQQMHWNKVALSQAREFAQKHWVMVMSPGSAKHARKTQHVLSVKNASSLETTRGTRYGWKGMWEDAVIAETQTPGQKRASAANTKGTQPRARSFSNSYHLLSSDRLSTSLDMLAFSSNFSVWSSKWLQLNQAKVTSDTSLLRTRIIYRGSSTSSTSFLNSWIGQWMSHQPSSTFGPTLWMSTSWMR